MTTATVTPNSSVRGNPYNIQLSRFRRILIDAVTDEEVREIGREIVRQAVAGSMTAAQHNTQAPVAERFSVWLTADS